MVSNPRSWIRLARLAAFIHYSYPESRPLSVAPQCSFESLYVLAEPSESTRPCFRVYPHVDKMMTDVREHVAVLAKGTKPLSAIFPKRRRSHSVAAIADLTAPLAVNSDFLQLAEISISTKRLGTVSFFISSTKSLLEANSYSLWLLSGLLSQFKRDGFAPSDSAISSLSASLSGQTRTAASLSDFIISKCWESYLGLASLPLSALQKQELLITPGSDSSLFDQGLLEKVSGQVKEFHLVLLVPGQTCPLADVQQGQVFIDCGGCGLLTRRYRVPK